MTFNKIEVAVVENGFVLKRGDSYKVYKDDETQELIKTLLVLAKAPKLSDERNA